jgi:hypothetical protein
MRIILLFSANWHSADRGRASRHCRRLRPMSEHSIPPNLLRCELAAVGYQENGLDPLSGWQHLPGDFRAADRRQPDAARSYGRVQSAISLAVLRNVVPHIDS